MTVHHADVVTDGELRRAQFFDQFVTGISTHCGFESGTNAPLDAADQEARLTLVADVAHDVWAHEGSAA